MSHLTDWLTELLWQQQTDSSLTSTFSLASTPALRTWWSCDHKRTQQTPKNKYPPSKNWHCNSAYCRTGQDRTGKEVVGSLRKTRPWPAWVNGTADIQCVPSTDIGRRMTRRPRRCRWIFWHGGEQRGKKPTKKQNKNREQNREWWGREAKNVVVGVWWWERWTSYESHQELAGGGEPCQSRGEGKKRSHETGVTKRYSYHAPILFPPHRAPFISRAE